MWKTNFFPHKQYLFGLLFSINAKKAHTVQSISQTFLPCQKQNVVQTFKSSSCKKVFLKCVYNWYNFLRWIFFFHMIAGSHYFLSKFLVTQRLCTIPMLLPSLKQMLLNKPAFYMLSLKPNIWNKASTS